MRNDKRTEASSAEVYEHLSAINSLAKDMALRVHELQKLRFIHADSAGLYAAWIETARSYVSQDAIEKLNRLEIARSARAEQLQAGCERRLKLK